MDKSVYFCQIIQLESVELFKKKKTYSKTDLSMSLYLRLNVVNDRSNSMYRVVLKKCGLTAILWGFRNP